MTTTKLCKNCNTEKEVTCFYAHKGKPRYHCKECLKTYSKAYREKTRLTDEQKEQRKLYLRNYYQQNKDKFIEYRKTLNEKHPNYHTQYARRNRTKKKTGIASHLSVPENPTLL